MYTLTGLAHGRDGKVAYDAGINQSGLRYRSLKLAALQKTLKAPRVFGEDEGDLLIVGWGSTKGSIDEAVQRCREDGLRVSALHLTFLQPMASGIREIMQGFERVVCVEMNYSDDPADELITDDNRRYSSLAWLLRARYLIDVQSWSSVHGQPFKPGEIEKMIRLQVGR
jgi:2-oxoglutarate ferredoxin oxidoreductase subunit alpha